MKGKDIARMRTFHARDIRPIDYPAPIGPAHQRRELGYGSAFCEDLLSGSGEGEGGRGVREDVVGVFARVDCWGARGVC